MRYLQARVSLAITVILFLTGVALGAGGLFWYASLSPADSPGRARRLGQTLFQLPSFGESRRTDVRPTAVAALGRLEPRGGVIDLGGLMGDRLVRLTVQEGDEVKEGQVLGYLESHAVRKAERDAAASQLREARERLAAETAYAEALVAEARLAVKQSEELDPLDIQAQEARQRALQAELAVARSDRQRLRGVRAQGAISAQEIEHQIQVVTRAEEELASTRALLARARAGQGLNREKARAQLKSAEAGLRRARAAVQVESAASSLAMAEAQLERTVLRAPCAGRVLRKLTRPGEKVDTRPILRLGDTSTMVVNAEVYETDVLLVQPGQLATVTSPALAEPLTGTVEKVGLLVSRNDLLHVDPVAETDARVVEVRIRLDRPEAAAQLTNLQVDVKIDLNRRSSRPTDEAASPDSRPQP